MTGFGGTLSTFPNFLMYFATGALLTALFVLLYANLTPQRDITLIREGNAAAAAGMAGAVLGFIVPLASVIAHSAALVDLIAWGVVALGVQLGGFMIMRLVVPGLPQAIEAGNIAAAIFLAGVSLALGILNAACLAG